MIWILFSCLVCSRISQLLEEFSHLVLRGRSSSVSGLSSPVGGPSFHVGGLALLSGNLYTTADLARETESYVFLSRARGFETRS